MATTVLRDAADAIGKMIAGESITYYLYIEFENNAGVPVAPSVSVNDDVSYYLNLPSTNPTRDFFRVPLAAPVQTSASSGDYISNVVTVVGITSGVNGHHGLSFSSGSNSKVFGAALVAVRTVGDITQDLIVARSYFTAIAKGANTAFAITMPVQINI